MLHYIILAHTHTHMHTHAHTPPTPMVVYWKNPFPRGSLACPLIFHFFAIPTTLARVPQQQNR